MKKPKFRYCLPYKIKWSMANVFFSQALACRVIWQAGADFLLTYPLIYLNINAKVVFIRRNRTFICPGFAMEKTRRSASLS